MTNIRVTQLVGQSLEASNATKIRVTQLVAQSLQTTNTAKIRVTQVVAQVIFPFSCSPPTPPGSSSSGIYYIHIGKTNDSLYYSQYTTGGYGYYSIVVKIPNPFFIL